MPEGQRSATSERQDDRPEQDDEHQSRGDAKAPPKDEAPEKHSRWPLIALGIAVVIAIIAGVVWYLMTKDQMSTDDAYTDGRAVMVTPQVSGYVTKLAINDNQFVHKDEVLLELDDRQYKASRDQAAGQVAATEAQLANAKVALEKQRVTAPADLLAAQGQLDEAQAQLTQTQAEYKRQHSVDKEATTQQNVDKANAGLQQAQGQVEEAKAKVQQANLVSQNVAQAEAQVAQLEGQLLQSKASLAQAEINLGYTKILAPQDGWVTKRNVELGDYAQTGTAVTAIVSPQIWITANYKETELDRMRPGQRVDIVVDAYPGLKLTGHVDSIQLGSGSRFSAFPAENATGNYVKIVQRVPVKILIDSGLDPNLPLPLGVSVEPIVYFK